MTINLSQKTIDAIVDAVVQRLQQQPQTEYVRTSEAAKILGVSEAYLRQTKGKYSYKKSSDKQQGALMFRKDTLIK